MLESLFECDHEIDLAGKLMYPLGTRIFMFLNNRSVIEIFFSKIRFNWGWNFTRLDKPLIERSLFYTKFRTIEEAAASILYIPAKSTLVRIQLNFSGGRDSMIIPGQRPLSRASKGGGASGEEARDYLCIKAALFFCGFSRYLALSFFKGFRQMNLITSS